MVWAMLSSSSPSLSPSPEEAVAGRAACPPAAAVAAGLAAETAAGDPREAARSFGNVCKSASKER